MAEYVCLDGRMSVNGICPASSYPGYQDPTEDTVTTPVTDNNQNGGSGGKDDFTPTKTFDQKYESIEDIPTKDYSKDVKSNFQWDFDKVGNKIENFGTTIKGNINAYDKYVEENLGIPRDISHGLRAASIGMGVVKYGALGALAPFAIPLVVGSALNSQKRKEEYKIDQNQMRDEVATIQSRVDNQYQNQLTNDGRDFSVSGDNVSSNKKGADNRASQERGYQLHG